MTQVKICGVTSVDDALAAVRAGADAVGINFVLSSPRSVSEDQAQEISRALAGKVVRVGVFCDAALERVKETVDRVNLDMVQLHGSETPEYAEAVGLPVIKALPADEKVNENAQAYPDLDLLLDNPGGGGGTGKQWEYLRARSLVAKGRRVWLAGGLNPRNVADAVRTACPHGVDASSGLERRVGAKDELLMREFVEQAKRATWEMDRTRLPDPDGNFGEFGGRYVPETLIPALEQLTQVYTVLHEEVGFWAELDRQRRSYIGRPTPLYFATRLSEELGIKVFLKREDLAHTGAHKINNAIGQALIARRMGKRRIIAETGAGQHGVATATACARFDLECCIYMGEEDMARQALNVHRMRLLGAMVMPVRSGTRTLKDAMNEAMRDWATNVRSTYYLIGSTAGPHPYPMLVRDLQSVIGAEAREQILAAEGRLPGVLIACVGGGSNAMGLFHAFRGDIGVRFVGVEAAGRGLTGADHCAPLCAGTVGVLHGSRSYLLQTPEGQVRPTHSISAGLDYPGVGPEHAYLKASGRAEYVAISDEEALSAFVRLSRTEGIIPAFESAHAVAELFHQAPGLAKDSIAIVNISGRGDKDVDQSRHLLGSLGE